MSKIRIKNFGPIKDGFSSNEYMDIKKITIFIGNQGSGKSTVAKLISTLTWLEKSLYRGDIQKSEVTRKSKFQNFYCGYQGLKNYFSPNTKIEYKGEAFDLIYKSNTFHVIPNKRAYTVPKIMYVPAERNFVSAVAQPDKLKYLPKPLYTFLDEFERSKQELSDNIKLPINNLEFQYEQKKGISRVIGENHNVILSEASSGIQSSIPLFLVSKNLAEGINKKENSSVNKISLEEMIRIRKQLERIITDKKLTEELRTSAIEILSSVSKNDCFINIVEEPEQNLYPISQRHILNELISFNNMNPANKLIFTTHSPYIINYLTLAVKAFTLTDKINKSDRKDKLNSKLNSIVPSTSKVNPDDWVVYELDDKGNIIKLPDYNQLPSDENYLNEKLSESNELFAQLLEIQQEL